MGCVSRWQRSLKACFSLVATMLVGWRGSGTSNKFTSTTSVFKFPGLLRNVKLFQLLKFSADGLVKQQTIGEDVTECARRAIHEHSPYFQIIANNHPALVAGHP